MTAGDLCATCYTTRNRRWFGGPRVGGASLSFCAVRLDLGLARPACVAGDSHVRNDTRCRKGREGLVCRRPRRVMHGSPIYRPGCIVAGGRSSSSSSSGSSNSPSRIPNCMGLCGDNDRGGACLDGRLFSGLANPQRPSGMVQQSVELAPNAYQSRQ